jgi:hypothetical protein
VWGTQKRALNAEDSLLRTVKISTAMLLIGAAAVVFAILRDRIISEPCCRECSALEGPDRPRMRLSSRVSSRRSGLRLSACAFVADWTPHARLLMRVSSAMKMYRAKHDKFTDRWEDLNVWWSPGAVGQPISLSHGEDRPPKGTGSHWRPRASGLELVITEASSELVNIMLFDDDGRVLHSTTVEFDASDWFSEM